MERDASAAGTVAHATTAEDAPPGGMSLAAVALHVGDLPKSVTFYRALLGLRESDLGTPTAALLFNDDGFQLYLRAVGHRAPHPLGAIGVQCVVWSASDVHELRRCEEWLKAHRAYAQTMTSDDITWVEGRDPNHLPVMVTYPRPGLAVHHRILSRIYAL
ncbi:VOC family protein [Streptomyces sp. SID14478]|uniref:VOC family protein n=1 Tax=Streptomyces sp. SID14478 TaxID=2706073 RepID=UPI0013DB7514|nr:VOC family protein [Streptomyces sp. SID14478]NEB76366.1 VOC family protein [Streptomyces sp. SID14478]